MTLEENVGALMDAAGAIGRDRAIALIIAAVQADTIRRQSAEASGRGRAAAAKRWGAMHPSAPQCTPSDAPSLPPRASPSSLPSENKSLSARSQDPEPVARTTGQRLLRRYAEIRAEILGGFPWSIPPTSDGKADTFAERLADLERADVEPTMRRMFEHVRDGADGWTDPKLTKQPAYGFASWMAQFTALREEIHGKSPRPPPARPKPETPTQSRYQEL